MLRFELERLAMHRDQSASERGWVSLLTERALRRADHYVALAPPTVRGKLRPAPSGDWQDYFHPAPYWWPDAANGTRTVWVRRDGQRAPGTEGDGRHGTEAYDRWALQRLFDETYVLALAGHLSEDGAYFDAASARVDAWFVAAETAMRPHLTYAQFRPATGPARFHGHGLIEFIGVVHLLDALRILEAQGLLVGARRDAVRDWFRAFLDYLERDTGARGEFERTNNRGTWAEVQRLAVKAWLGIAPCDESTLERLRLRLEQQVERDGRQPEESARSLPLHYSTYNLQAWSTLRGLLPDDRTTSTLRSEADDAIRRGCAWIRSRAAAWSAREPGFDPRRLDLLERGTTAPAHEFHFTTGIRPLVALGTRR